MTLRETYIEALIALFGATTGFPAQVERSIVKAISRAEGSTVVVHRGGEPAPDNSMLGVIDRTCEILVSVVTRDDTPDKIADEIMEVVHPLVMTYSTAGIIDVWEGQTDTPKFSNTNGQACLLTVHYFIKYRTSPNSLST